MGVRNLKAHAKAVGIMLGVFGLCILLGAGNVVPKWVQTTTQLIFIGTFIVIVYVMIVDLLEDKEAGPWR